MSDWPDSKEFWRSNRVMVTGGNGFLGKYVVRKLQERGADVFVVRQDCYDLRRLEDIRRALSGAKPQMVSHRSAEHLRRSLAARVSGRC